MKNKRRRIEHEEETEERVDKRGRKKSKKKGKVAKVLLSILFELIFIPVVGIYLVYYGPFTHIRDLIVTTSMVTMSHQYFATAFLSDEVINEIIEREKGTIDVGEQELNEIEINTNINATTNDPTQGIELIDISTSTYKGYLLIISDPSRVKLVAAPRLGTVGATVPQIVEHYDGIAGINGGGFLDDALGTGGKPDGLLMLNNELLYGNRYTYYSAVGMDNENKLVVSNGISYDGLLAKGVSDAVSFGPTIVVNGYGTISSSGSGGGGLNPRTAIGQRKDGAILMLVIDGRQPSSLGATLRNVQDVMLQYGAYNVFNLDGGASSTMFYNGKLVNSPSDIMGERYVPCAFIVTK